MTIPSPRAATRVCPYGGGRTRPQIHALGASTTSRGIGITVMERSVDG